MISSGLEHATFQLVAQCFNDYTIACPRVFPYSCYVTTRQSSHGKGEMLQASSSMRSALYQNYVGF
jgi:hypothetical protein